MKTALPNIPALAALLWLACLCPCLAQSEPESGNGSLYIQSIQGYDEVRVRPGTVVSVRYKNDPYLYRKVEMKGVVDSSAIFGTDTVGIRYVEELVVRREQMYQNGRRILMWSIISVVGFWVTFAAAFLLGYGYGSALAVFFMILAALLSIPAGAAFPTGIIVGIVMLASAAKHYRIHREWRLSNRHSTR